MTSLSHKQENAELYFWAAVEEGPLAPISSRTAATDTREDGLSRERAPDGKRSEVLSSGIIKFDNVKFSYEPNELVIKGFSATVDPGMTVAIVGPTGAGKTTLVNLLMRFYDPTSGTITIGGTDTTTVPRSEVRQLFGMVLQDT